MEEKAYVYALENAIKFKGKANPGPVIGKLLSEYPKAKDDHSLPKFVQSCIIKVNGMSLYEQEGELRRLAPELLEKKPKQKKEMPELKNAEKGKVVTRIPPEPSKYLHIGHALSFLINAYYAKEYEGKVILRFEDTNPEKSTQEYADAILDDIINYLGISPSAIKYFSDDMAIFYEYAEKLITEGHAYVDFTEREEMQRERSEGIESAYRNTTIEENMNAWKDMLAGVHDAGVCVLRLKIDMQADNHVMRDPAIFRIIKDTHYRQGDTYCVWPLYDLAGSIEEELFGVTPILRSSEFGGMRVELQSYIKKILGLKDQYVRQYGRINIHGSLTKGREIREGRKQVHFIGWDDPRLVTLKALKRRGIARQTYYEIMKQAGLSASPTNIDFTMIAAANRKLLDPLADRLFCIREPIEITIIGAPEHIAKIHRHPDHPERGERTFITHNNFLIEKHDFHKLGEGKTYRLMECLNFIKKGKEFHFHSFDYQEFRERGEATMHWLPAGDGKEITIMMPDATIISAIAEDEIIHVEEGSVIQFERLGFCRLDDKRKLLFWFGHE